jgi:hypothetical protein
MKTLVIEQDDPDAGWRAGDPDRWGQLQSDPTTAGGPAAWSRAWG